VVLEDDVDVLVLETPFTALSAKHGISRKLIATVGADREESTAI
jgi:hypothetical protein